MQSQLDAAVTEIGAAEDDLTSGLSPFQAFSRGQWAALAKETPMPLTPSEVSSMSGLSDPIDIAEVDAIYRPLSKLLEIYFEQRRTLADSRHDFLHEIDAPPVPFIVGIAGSVAVGKSSIARVLRQLLLRFPASPRVDLVTTDGFLLPNAELERLGLMRRKGFPESYDRRRLVRFLGDLKAGLPRVSAPVYSHVVYDIVPGQEQVLRCPDIVIIEGINVLQPPRVSTNQPALAVSDYFDFSIFIDANHAHIERWYIDRFLTLRSRAFSEENSYFKSYATLDDDTAVDLARQIWTEINLVNYVQNIRPTRSRADLIIAKDADHRVREILLRKI